MPTYSYICTNEKCENFDKIVSEFLPVSARDNQKCKICKKKLDRNRMNQSPGVTLKGGGWFKRGSF